MYKHTFLNLAAHLQLSAPRRGMEWNGREISVWSMEDARMEWKISRME